MNQCTKTLTQKLSGFQEVQRERWKRSLFLHCIYHHHVSGFLFLSEIFLDCIFNTLLLSMLFTLLLLSPPQTTPPHLNPLPTVCPFFFLFFLKITNWVNFVLLIYSWVWSHPLKHVALPKTVPLRKIDSLSPSSRQLLVSTYPFCPEMSTGLILCRQLQLLWIYKKPYQVRKTVLQPGPPQLLDLTIFLPLLL